MKKIVISLLILSNLLLAPSYAHANDKNRPENSKDITESSLVNKPQQLSLPKSNPKPSIVKPKPKDSETNQSSSVAKNPTPTNSPSSSKSTPLLPSESDEEDLDLPSSFYASKINQKLNSLIKNKMMSTGQSQAVLYAILTTLESKSRLNLDTQISTYDTNKYIKREQLLSLVERLQGNYAKANLTKRAKELNFTQKQLQVLKIYTDLSMIEKKMLINETLSQLLANGTITDQLQTQLALTLYKILL